MKMNPVSEAKSIQMAGVAAPRSTQQYPVVVELAVVGALGRT